MKQFIKVTLPEKIKIKVFGNREIEIEEIEIFQMVDNPLRKTVTVLCRNHPKSIVLWKDSEYDAIGQWTDTDVINRIKELYEPKTE